MIICLILDLIYAVLGVILSPWILYRMIFHGRYRYGWAQRFGFVRKNHSAQPCIWIHAVSLGEVNATGTLIEQIERILPQHRIVISTTTDTGMERAKKLYGQRHKVIFWPWDFSWAVARALDRLAPRICVLMELEVWYNFTAVAKKRGVKLIVANGRISSSKGFPRYRKIAPLVRNMFARLDLVLAQDKDYAERFRFLGVPPDRIEIIGTLKYDTAEITDNVPGADEIAQKLMITEKNKIWVCGSTGPDEEKIILETYKKLKTTKQTAGLRLIIVPRKPERFDEVARLIETYGYGPVRFSEIKQGDQKLLSQNGEAVILGDTMGDLRKFYSLADVVFVGRSLVPMGGSDMIEAAALAKPVVVGPYTENFTESVKLLKLGGGIEIVENAEEFTEVTKRLLSAPAAAESLGKLGQKVVAKNQGASKRTAKEIAELLGYQAPLGDNAIATPKPD